MDTSDTSLLQAQLNRELRKFVKTVKPEEQADFFHSMNRDQWMRAFAEYLVRPREFASND